MKSIPTLFNGIEYRSRLEARWAAMFGLIDSRFCRIWRRHHPVKEANDPCTC